MAKQLVTTPPFEVQPGDFISGRFVGSFTENGDFSPRLVFERQGKRTHIYRTRSLEKAVFVEGASYFLLCDRLVGKQRAWRAWELSEDEENKREYPARPSGRDVIDHVGRFVEASVESSPESDIPY